MAVPLLLSPVIDSDTFAGGARAGVNAWSPASGGSNWAVAVGTGTIAVATNEGTITNINGLQVMNLGSTTLKDGEAVMRWSTSANAAEVHIHLRGNGTGATRYYFRSKASQQWISKDIAGSVTQISNTGAFTTVNSTFYWFRFRVVAASLFGKIWQDGNTEPGAWTVVATDSQITGAGNFGVGCNPTATTTTVSYDNFTVSKISGQGIITNRRQVGRVQ